MDNEKLQINLAPGQDHAEIVLREVGNENPYKLPAKEPLNLQVDGVITCIYAFLEKRWGTDQIDKEHTHILVNREKLVVTLVTNENDERTTQTIIGSIQLSRQFKSFHINDGELWKPVQLGDFFRLNRSYFETKEKNMELVNLLKSFSAKVQTTIKKELSDNGSVTDNYEKAVDSNLPSSFVINVPIFKGAEPEKLSIETIAHVEGNMALLTLISADAECIIEESRDKIINTELDKIRKLCPEIPYYGGIMSRINEIIASMPPGEAAAVIHLREVHACLMDLDKNHARTLAARAVYLDYLEGEGRKLCKNPRHYERVTSKGEKVTVETYFSYINRVH